MRIYAILSIAFVFAACSNEIEYKVKFCELSSRNLSLYIDKNLTTYSINGLLRDRMQQKGEYDIGSIERIKMRGYFEYKGNLNFVAFGKGVKPFKIDGHDIEFSDDGYVVVGKKKNGNKVRFKFDSDGYLLGFDEILSTIEGPDIVVHWNNCGGSFVAS